MTVSSSWTRQDGSEVTTGGRVTVMNIVSQTGGLSYTSTLEFNTLRTTDSDTYTCTATVTPSASLPNLRAGQDSDDTMVTVVSKCIAVFLTCGCVFVEY